VAMGVAVLLVLSLAVFIVFCSGDDEDELPYLEERRKRRSE
jgi:hypothetical protein